LLPSSDDAAVRDGGADLGAARDGAVTNLDANLSQDGPASDGPTGPDPLAAGLCEGRWCWSNPLPQGNRINGFWARGRNDVWAVGDMSTILHWDGGKWTRVSTGVAVGRNLSGVWATADGGQVYAMGSERLYHYNGSTWRNELPPTLPIGASPAAISAATADDVWVVGSGGLVMHGDGQRFTVQPFVTGSRLEAVVALGPRDVWAGGASMFHYDGQGWTEVPVRTGDAGVKSLWTTAGGEVWALATPVVVHLTGNAWAPVPGLFTQSAFVNGASGTGPRDIWVAESDQAHHFDGDRWTHYPTGRGVQAAVAATPDDAWVGGYQGQLFHYEGQTLARFSQGQLFKNTRVVATAGAADLLVTGEALLHHTAGGWERAAQIPVPVGLVATGNRDVWGFSASGELLHWDGQSWLSLGNQLPSGAGGFIKFAAVAGTGPEDLWAVGNNGQVLHYDGRSSNVVVSATLFDLYDAWAIGPGDVWAVGEGGMREHYTTAAGWQKVLGPGSSNFRGVWGSGPSDVWAVGDSNIIVHFDGSTWKLVTPPTETYPLDFYAVAGRAPDDVWAVGQRGVAVHWDGRAWRTVATGCAEDLHGLRVGPDGDVWAVGDAGAILHYR
jgi:hypothetical protein